MCAWINTNSIMNTTHALLSNLLTKLNNDTVGIPRWNHIKEAMIDLFGSNDSLAMVLITHYYITGRSSTMEIFHSDPADQAAWCKAHLPYSCK